jgi:hypothetical protein
MTPIIPLILVLIGAKKEDSKEAGNHTSSEAALLGKVSLRGSRDRPFDIYMDSYDQSVDAIVAIAMHAGAGNRSGFISHTYTMEDVEYRVNGDLRETVGGPESAWDKKLMFAVEKGRRSTPATRRG